MIPSVLESSPSRRSVLSAAVGAGGILALSALAAGPRPAVLGRPRGDQDLTAALEPHLGGHHRVVAAVIDRPAGSDGGASSGGDELRTRLAGFGADATTEFEIGSVTKTFTGALLMDAVSRGEVELGTTVAEILGQRAAGSEAADVDLAELASHSSGLPRLPMARTLIALPGSVLRRDPYRGVEPDELIEAALGSSTDGRGEYAYSNLGLAFLGHLLAERSGAPWHELLQHRILDPLGLADTRAPAGPEQLGDEAPTGRTTTGLPAGAWTNPGYGPAGTIRSTARDMATYLRTMIDGSNPGAAGLDPVLERDEDRAMAVTWGLRGTDEGTIISHTGMTGGFAAYCGWHTGSGRGVVLLTATERDLDDLGAAYLEGSLAL